METSKRQQRQSIEVFDHLGLWELARLQVLSPRSEVPGLEEDRAEIRQMAEELGLGWCIPDGKGS